jgi:hypothetical protein
MCRPSVWVSRAKRRRRDRWIAWGVSPRMVGQTKNPAAERRQMPLGLSFSVAPLGLTIYVWPWTLGLTPQAKYLPPLRGSRGFRSTHLGGIYPALPQDYRHSRKNVFSGTHSTGRGSSIENREPSIEYPVSSIQHRAGWVGSEPNPAPPVNLFDSVALKKMTGLLQEAA